MRLARLEHAISALVVRDGAIGARGDDGVEARLQGAVTHERDVDLARHQLATERLIELLPTLLTLTLLLAVALAVRLPLRHAAAPARPSQHRPAPLRQLRVALIEDHDDVHRIWAAVR